MNGDGYDDVVAAAPRYTAGESREGRAYLYYGSPSGIEPAAGWTAEGNQAESGFGSGGPRAGDVTGDGYADILLGAPSYDAGTVDAGRVFLYPGSPDGPAATPGWTVDGEQAAAHFGAAAAGAGDLNGDGYADVVIGAPGQDGAAADEGVARVYDGSAAGPANSPSLVVRSALKGTNVGAAAAGAYDVDGNGGSDLLVGVPGYDSNEANTGAALVYYGAAGARPTPTLLRRRARPPRRRQV